MLPPKKPLKKLLASSKEETNTNCERIEDVLLIENKYRIKSMLLSEEMLEISNSMRRAVDSKWKKELLATLKQKYRIKDNELVEDRQMNEQGG